MVLRKWLGVWFSLTPFTQTLNGSTNDSYTQGDASTTIIASNPSGDGITWVLQFSGSSVIGNSIEDGDYNLNINHALITLLSNRSTTMAADYTNHFYRLFGDVNGTGAVGNTENQEFSNAYGVDPAISAYVSSFNFDLNMATDPVTGDLVPTVGNNANQQFGSRFGTIWTNL